MTPYIEIQHITKSFGDLLLIDDVSFSIAEGQHIGIIAKNGFGKTTLLNILAGRDTCDSGNVIKKRDLRIGYLEQSPKYDPSLSVIDACFSKADQVYSLISQYEICLQTPGTPGIELLIEEMERQEAWDFETKAKQILSKLNINNFSQPMGQLSGGQVKRVALANVLINEPDLLILDEPTNHLDIEMIEWLENYLKRGGRTLLMVTHDRYFLDRVCETILELDGKQIYTYRGNYEYYLEKRQERINVTNATISKAQNLYRKELDWMRRMPSARGTKAKYRKDAFYELEAIAKKRIEERNARIEVKSEYIGSKIFEAEYVSKSFKQMVNTDDCANPDCEIKILSDFYYNFSRYEKMGIVGGNGTGKSTFIKLLLGIEKPDSGRFVIGETVKFGYFSQDGMTFNEDEKVIDAVRKVAEAIDLGEGKKLSAMQFLSHFLFPPARQQDYIRKLSGGERRRLQLCIVLMTNPNFLILDEPTNDLDISTLQILEDYLSNFKGCVIVVSHDRYFMDRVVDHLLVFKGGGVIKDFPGNYSQYREWNELKEEEEKELHKKNPPSIVVHHNRQSAQKKRRLTFAEKQEIIKLESDIELLEAEKSDLESQLCSGNIPIELLTTYSKRLPQLQEELDEKSMRWLELSEIE